MTKLFGSKKRSTCMIDYFSKPVWCLLRFFSFNYFENSKDMKYFHIFIPNQVFTFEFKFKFL